MQLRTLVRFSAAIAALAFTLPIAATGSVRTPAGVNNMALAHSDIFASRELKLRPNMTRDCPPKYTSQYVGCVVIVGPSGCVTIEWYFGGYPFTISGYAYKVKTPQKPFKGISAKFNSNSGGTVWENPICAEEKLKPFRKKIQYAEVVNATVYTSSGEETVIAYAGILPQN